MKIAVLGYGVVGSGVVELIFKNAASIEKNADEKIEIKYILDIRDFPDHPHADLFTKDFEKIVQDPEIGVVVEVIGGLSPAYSFVKRSLKAGKSVVTSNKELVATYGADLLQTAREYNTNFMFEASVGGGIPIIRPITQCFAANNIDRIYGILNGTTNYILSKMITDGDDFDTALAKAQKNGYAEANPAADIDGVDACRKIAILGSLAFGRHIDPNAIQTEGIRGFELKDVLYAKKAGYTVKLLGVVSRREGGRVYALVAPFLLPLNSKLAACDGVFNEIYVEGDAVGETMFYGRGAGKLPTASAVVADVIDCVVHKDFRKDIFWEAAEQETVVDFKKEESTFYVRFSGECAAQKVSDAFSVAQIIEDGDEFSAILSKMPEDVFYNKVAALEKDGCVRLCAKYRLFC